MDEAEGRKKEYVRRRENLKRREKGAPLDDCNCVETRITCAKPRSLSGGQDRRGGVRKPVQGSFHITDSN